MSDPTTTPEPTTTTETTPAATAPEPTTPAPKPPEPFDQERAMATIHAQREAEKTLKAQLAEAKKAQDKLAEIEAEKLSAEERALKAAEEATAKATGAAEKLRKANLITALADAGLTGAKAKAAAKLLDGLDYDDDDEPTNLDDAITRAKAEYGDDLFQAVAPPPPNVNPATGTTKQPGPALTEDELRVAKQFGMTPEEYQAYKEPGYRPPAPATT